MFSNNHQEHQFPDAQEEEVVYALMMDALDGELSASRWDELQAHLRTHPHLAQEWQAWQAVDQLLHATPALAPAADFTERTLARLPNLAQRRAVLGTLYTMLLILGALPVIGLAWISFLLLPLLTATGPLGGVVTFAASLLTVAQVVVKAAVGSTIDFVAQYPYVLGWLFVMAGLVFLWNGVYQQLTLQVARTRA
jgi:anti-sigma factor RsiW